MRLFFSTDITGDIVRLDADETAHCKVLRLRCGDKIAVTDGCGNLHNALIERIDIRDTVARIVDTTGEFGKRSYHMHIAIAPTKSPDRLEWFVEKATEIGIDEISPIICHNSERRWLKTDRLNKIAEAAMKQSYKAYHPVIHVPTDFADFMGQSFAADHKFIAHCLSGNKPFMAGCMRKHGSYLVLIGPEGDFTVDEIAHAERLSFLSVGLGESRLRTETAAIVACNMASIIHSL